MDFKTFLDHFDTIAQAPNGIAKLRSLILDLAIWGKLVPQKSDDKSASILLEKIAVEKEQLIREKRIKKTAFLTETVENEKPFELPEGWEWCRISDIVFALGDGLHGTPQYTINSEYYFVNGNNLRNGKIVIKPDTKTVAVEEFEKYKKPLSSNTVLVSINGTLGNVAFYNNEQIILGKSACYLNFAGCINKHYIKVLLEGNYFLEYAYRNATGTTIKNLSLRAMHLFPVPLPPLEEQQRIVEKVDELMALCDLLQESQETRDHLRQKLRESAIASLMNAETDEDLQKNWAIVRDNWHTLSQKPEDVNDLRRSVIQLAVEGNLVEQDLNNEPASLIVKRALEEREKLTAAKKISKRESQPPIEEYEVPFDLPKGWECIRLGEITDIVSGVTKGRNLAGKKTSVYPYLRVANVQRWYLDLEVMKEIEILEEELDKYRLQIGDVLLTEGGDWDKLGRSAIWRGEIKDCIHQNHVFRARSLDSGLLPEWIVMFTNSLAGRKYFESAAKRTTNLASINMTQLRFCPLPIPPEEEQKRIVAKMDELLEMCKQLQDSLRQSQQWVEALAASAISHLTV